MKKKCTNSSCRRTFFYKVHRCLVVCPYCGKTYTRLGRAQKYMVYNAEINKMQDLSPVEKYLREGYKLRAIKYLRHELGWEGLKECKNTVDRILATCCYPLTYYPGHRLTWSAAEEHRMYKK